MKGVRSSKYVKYRPVFLFSYMTPDVPWSETTNSLQMSIDYRVYFI